MAEGRSATLLFHLQKRGFNVTGSTPDSEDDGFVTIKLRVPLPWMMAYQLKHGMKTTLFLMRHGLWPASVTTLVTVMSGVTLLTVFAESDSWLRSGWLADLLWNIDTKINPLQRRMSVGFRVAYLAAFASLSGFYGIVWAERLLLRVLLRLGPTVFLSARSRKTPSHIQFVIQCWIFLIKKLSGRRNLTFGYQLTLPFLPVPSLKRTTEKFLNSVKPILPPEELQQVQQLSESFLKNEGRKLQRYLQARSFVLSNYVTPWFERYVYLMSRAPLAVDSNYYVMDTMKPSPVKDQVFRAANIAYHLLAFQELVESEQLEPRLLQDTVPLCMAQYERLFCTTRIPGREVDVLKHRRGSDYILVVRRGRFYKVKVKREDGVRLTQAELAHQFRLITEHANLDAASRGPNCEEKDLMALTSLPRTMWAEVRDRYFGEGQNRKSLLTIEKASFVVHLVSESRLSSPSSSASSPSSSSSPTRGGRFFATDEVSLNKRAHYLFHGEGSDIWFDKSFNLLVFEDGQAGINAEITFGDAPVVAHMWEYALLNELIDFENCRDASALAGESLRGAPLPMPLRLEFNISEQLTQEIRKAKKEAKDAYKDIELDILCFNSFGKDFIKTLGVSPDAFLQMALLLTTYVDGPENRFGLAYESCHTRLFRDGRTETIRSVTKESMAFIRAGKSLMGHIDEGENHVLPSTEELADAKTLLGDACAAHQQVSIESVSGKGIDRHLFALNVAAKGLEIKSEFLDFANTRLKWSLSSSQQPQVQTKLRSSLPQHIVQDFFCPGGGYAPISDEGYGVAYTMTATDLFFHVTCKKSCAQTNARRFTANLHRALELLKMLLTEVRPSQPNDSVVY